MTALPAPARRPSLASPLRIAGAIAQLAALGIVGSGAFALVLTFLALGIGLLPVFLVGVLFLLALVYILYALAWVAAARADGLYDLRLPPLRPRRSPRSGFRGFLHTIWLQAIDGAQWRAIASGAIATVFGFVILPLLTLLAAGVALIFAPLYARGDTVEVLRFDLAVATAWAPLAGVLAVIGSLAAIVGLAIADAALCRVILVPSREAQFAAEARASREQRAGAVRAAEVERTRIERDLHDGVQPRLVSIGMTLGLAQQKIDSDPAAAKALIAEAHASTKAAVTELRQLARGIHTAVLDDRGLDAALSALAARSHIPVTLDVRIAQRCSRPAEAAVYFAIAEALTNAAKHSRATACRVLVRQPDAGTLWARVEDDGIGGARIVPGGGLDGLVNRVAAAGGVARIDSMPGGPTTVEVTVPCAS
ncbi:histidine kinase [Microbacterium sp. X-17]|uniref:sensor histidine kinase n=1 Tax=Microbacterium sp. X-17 TaxID=3144404 RepID=UPI0031F505C4